MIWDKFLVVNHLHQTLLFFNPPPLPNAKRFGGTGFLGGTRQQWFLSLKTRRKEGRWKAQHGEDRKQCTSATTYDYPQLLGGHTQTIHQKLVNIPGHEPNIKNYEGRSVLWLYPRWVRPIEPFKVLIYKLYQTLAPPTPKNQQFVKH